MNPRNLILILIIVAIVLVGGYFLLKGGYQAPTVPSTSVEEITPSPPGEVISPPTEEEEVTPSPTVREITVSGTEFSFNPASITVSAGEQLKITFRNDGSIIHNFKITELGVGTKTIGPGNTDTIEFTAQTSGTYTFLCSVPGHRASGMEGELTVQ